MTPKVVEILPIFEFTGTTDVVWGKINPLTGADIVFDGTKQALSLITLMKQQPIFMKLQPMV